MITIEERQRFVFWAHARVCFENCVDVCTYLIENRLDPTDPLYKPLSSSAIVEYGKPFSGNKGMLERKLVRELEKKVIPEEHMELHRYLIRSRNQMFAHIDMETGEDGEELIHSVRIEVKDRALFILSGEPKVHPMSMAPLKDLSMLLHEKALWHSNKGLGKFKKLIVNNYRRKSGEYLINLEPESKPLRKLKNHERPTLYWDD